MEFENNELNEVTSDVDSGISTPGEDPDGVFASADIDGDGTIAGVAFEDAFIGTNADDVLTGGDANDFLISGAGNDNLNGGAGDDTLEGSFGADTINGGAGTDTVSFDGFPAAVTINLATGVATASGEPGVADLLVDIENVIGTFSDDVIIGNDVDNRINGSVGFDTIDGGAGNDTAVYDNLTIPVSANLSTGLVSFPGSPLVETLINVENLVGGVADDILVGSSEDNQLFGNAGNDFLEGGVGSDTLDGFEGSDTFVFTSGALGADLVTDFEDGVDSLDVSSFGFDSAALNSVIGAAQQIGGDALLTFETSNTVLLRNTQTADIDTSDFVV